jgi:hypothetical protein
MPRRRRTSEQIGTAGFSPIDTPTDTSLENFEPDTTTGRIPKQDEDLERGTRAKRRTRKSGSTTDRK